MKNVFFLVIVLAGVLFVVAAGLNADQIYGTRTWPVTYEVLEVLGGTFGLFILIIITFYSGELVWRERDAGRLDAGGGDGGVAAGCAAVGIDPGGVGGPVGPV